MRFSPIQTTILCTMSRNRKKYGIVYRLILSYDMVFLALVLENFETEMTPLSFKCPTNPFKKINTSISNNVIEYCAFINYYLSVLKLEDDIIDEKNNVKKIPLNYICLFDYLFISS